MCGRLVFFLEPILMIEGDGFHEASGTDYSAVTEIPDTVQQLTDEAEISVLLP